MRKSNRNNSHLKDGNRLNIDTSNSFSDQVSNNQISQLADSVDSLGYQTGVDRDGDTSSWYPDNNNRIVDWIGTMRSFLSSSFANEQTQINNLTTTYNTLVANRTNLTTSVNSLIAKINAVSGLHATRYHKRQAHQWVASAVSSVVAFPAATVGKIFFGFMIGGGAGGAPDKQIHNGFGVQGGFSGEAGFLKFFQFLRTSEMHSLSCAIGSGGNNEVNGVRSSSDGGTTSISFLTDANQILGTVSALGGNRYRHYSSSIINNSGYNYDNFRGVNVSNSGAIIDDNTMQLFDVQTQTTDHDGIDQENMYLHSEMHAPKYLHRIPKPTEWSLANSSSFEVLIPGGWGGSHFAPVPPSFTITSASALNGKQGSNYGDGGSGGGRLCRGSNSDYRSSQGGAGRSGFVAIWYDNTAFVNS